jgi:hypothetical protein
MLKQLTISLAAITVFFAAFLLLERSSSPFFQSCISEDGSNKGEETAKESDSRIGSIVIPYVRCTGRFIDAHGVGITAIFTIILSASTILLWVVTNTAAEAAKVAAEHIPTVEGANVYVLLKKETVEEDLQMIGMPNGLIRRDFTIKIQVSLKNFGKTPAVIERFTVRLSYGREKQIFGAVAYIQPNTVIGAGDEIEPPLIVSAPVLSKDDAEKIWRGESSLTLGGVLVYRDIWGNKWSAPFDGRNHFDAPVNFGNVGVGFRLDNQPRQKNA